MLTPAGYVNKPCNRREYQGSRSGRNLRTNFTHQRKIDSDSDGSLSAQEIAETSIVLTALDKNKDGMLTPDETHGGR
ncbi:MAG TPA: hypothetical protein DCE52_12620 [Rhodobacteraceae bacterium]|nr:hypothetical protein [Paracoccaceae bacterium]